MFGMHVYQVIQCEPCVVCQCHTGILGGGHYVAYAKNPNAKWYCYNDSSCKVWHHHTFYWKI